MRDNEPESYADISDASGTLLFDVGARDWSEPMLKPCGLTRAEVPQVHESYEKIGTVPPSVAAELGLPAGVVVCARRRQRPGGHRHRSRGPRVDERGPGTSGTVFIPTLSYAVGVGGILGSDDFAAAQEGIDAAVAPLDLPYFLPYLMGERTPHNDTAARGSFVGMSMSTTCADLTRAVLEGVAFAVRDLVEIARALGVDVRSSTVCGGGAKSRLWLQMLANILNIELKLPATEQGPGYGGAMLAGVAAGAFEDVAQACEKIVAVRDTVQPDPGAVGAYDARYLPWHDLYPALKSSFAKMGRKTC